MGSYGFASVAIGAVIGAWIRWGLGIALNPIVPTIPLGTLVANLLGGYLMGLALGFFEQFQALSPEARLLITTGFLGSLTTFSTFSLETVILVQRDSTLEAVANIAINLSVGITAVLIGGLIARQLARIT